MTGCSECQTVVLSMGQRESDRVCRVHKNQPWAGVELCPKCGGNGATLPYDGRVGPGVWRCLTCHLFFNVVVRKGARK